MFGPLGTTMFHIFSPMLPPLRRVSDLSPRTFRATFPSFASASLLADAPTAHYTPSFLRKLDDVVYWDSSFALDRRNDTPVVPQAGHRESLTGLD